MSIIVFAETSDGKLKKPACEASYYAYEMGKSLGLPVYALVIGAINESEAGILHEYGVNEISILNHDKLNSFTDISYAEALSVFAREKGGKHVVISQTYNGRALAPRLSIKLNAALISGVISQPSLSGASLVFLRTAYSGKAIQKISTSLDKTVITVKSNSVNLEKINLSGNINKFDFTPSEDLFKVKVVSVSKKTDKIPLTEAEVVVSGGRGLKGPENWGILEELAGAIKGSAMACSKPVADVHWRPHDEHVGQTGIQIAPNIYIAVGISGAIQHLAGVNSSKTIIVINKDPEAPFFKAADYGIVGDAFEVVPALTKAIKSYSNNN